MNLKQLPNVAAVLAEAATVENPVVAFHTDGGSAQAKFILHDKGDNRELGEMTRKTFNELRDNRHLDEDLEKRYRMHDRCQAWPVILPME